ncbi:MAG: SLC13 family permease [Bacteroidota bacterium]
MISNLPLIFAILFAFSIVALVTTNVKAYKVFGLLNIVAVLLGLISTEDLILQFANPSIVIIFSLIFISMGIERAFPITLWIDKIISRGNTYNIFKLKFFLFVSLISAILNNTPIVSLLTPYAMKKARVYKNFKTPSLLIILSYISILGGMLTIIGTSTTLVLNGFIKGQKGQELSSIDLVIPALIGVVVGLFFLTFFGDKILKSKKDVTHKVEFENDYTFELKIKKNSTLDQKPVSESGLRHLGDAYLFAIMREGKIIEVTSSTILLEKDILVFAGKPDSIESVMENIKGLAWVKDYQKVDDSKLIKCVVANNSFLISKTLQEIDFRRKYRAAVIAVQRKGKHLPKNLGTIRFQMGDVIIVNGGKEFEKTIQFDNSLYQISHIKDLPFVSKLTKFLIITFALIMVGLIAMSKISMMNGVLLVLISFVVGNVLRLEDLTTKFNFRLFLLLGFALSVGNIFIQTETLNSVIETILSICGNLHPFSILSLIFIITLILTNFVTNIAAVSIMFPIAYLFIAPYNLDQTALYLALAFGASGAFITPYSYQTNLLIQGPGEYTNQDFIKLGVPLTILYSVVVLSYIYIHFFG